MPRDSSGVPRGGQGHHVLYMLCPPSILFTCSRPTSIWLTFWDSYHTKSRFEDTAFTQTLFHSRWLAQGHAARSWQSQDENRGSSLTCPRRCPPITRKALPTQKPFQDRAHGKVHPMARELRHFSTVLIPKFYTDVISHPDLGFRKDGQNQFLQEA